tara:strand:+ start:3378 stop:3920 length:543 start_codon:yes stop_codon:yes gene_type:complete
METKKVWQYKSNSNDPLAKKVYKDPDIVMTKPEMAIDLLKLIDFKDGDKVLEPCKGTGAFYNNFPDRCENHWCEINEGKNFFDFTTKVDYIISNPPFVPRKLFWDFMEHSMTICNKEIWWLINLSSLNVFTPKRLEIMKDKGFFINRIHIVSDKRWFGRYCFIKISKLDNGFFSYNKITY